VVFKRMLRAFGVGGPSVDTVLANPNVRPGELLTGEVRIAGGDHAADIDQVKLSLVTRVEVESGDNEHNRNVEFARVVVGGRITVGPGQNIVLPFQFPVPLETPLTVVHGQHLHGMTMGLRTEVAIDRAVDKGDLDPIAVHPLPVHERILEAFSGLGFRFKTADLEYGRIHGVHQTLPFYQEIEYFPAPQYAHGINEIELTFVANPATVDVILEFDKRHGMVTGGHDTFGRYTVGHEDADTVDWPRQVDAWIRQALDSYQIMRGAYGRPAGYGMPGPGPAHGHHAPHSPYGHGGHRGHGSGMGGVVAGAAAGLAGGMLAGAMFDEVFEDDGGDE
jgi:sporulation-control protein